MTPATQPIARLPRGREAYRTDVEPRESYSTRTRIPVFCLLSTGIQEKIPAIRSFGEAPCVGHPGSRRDPENGAGLVNGSTSTRAGLPASREIGAAQTAVCGTFPTLRQFGAKMSNMKTYALKLEQSGRVLLPAELRKKLGVSPGEQVIVSVVNNTVALVGNRAAAVRKIQEELRPYRTKRSVVDELLAERRAEAETD